MTTLKSHKPDPASTLSKALLSAGRELGLTQAALGEIVGRDRSALQRNGIDPTSKSGELALLLIRAYRSLFALVGGGRSDLKHWMHTRNTHTGGIPAEQVKTVAGLMRVVGYLDAIRGKV